MNDARCVADPARSLLGLVLRTRVRSTWNHIRQVLTEAPLRVCITLILVAVIWFGLYWLFYLVFAQLHRTPLIATIAIPMVFNVFFLAMLVLLALSNAIIVYGALFSQNESTFLLTAPMTALDVVTFKYLESLAMASWALILLGVPMVLAMADSTHNPLFYPLFLAFFLAFLPIPGSLGLLLAWAAARFFTGHLRRKLTGGVALLVVGCAFAAFRTLQLAGQTPPDWLHTFYARMSFVEFAFLPNQWVAAGIDQALQDRFFIAGLYLVVTLANALFLSWLAVNIVAHRFERTLDRASTGHTAGQRAALRPGGGGAGWVFFYLPLRLRLIATKDLRTFLRDPLQWSQLLILFGLLSLYLFNIPTLKGQLEAFGWEAIIPFLNLCAIGFLLATFTCRFVFPLVSLEGQKLWLVALFPLPRGSVLFAKFAFAMTVTLAIAVSSMVLAIVLLELDLIWAAIHLAIIVGVCTGLCGFAVGLGACLPMFGETNAARIANGFGGTTNLLASAALLAVILGAAGIATWRSRYLPGGTLPDLTSMALCLFSLTLGAGAGLAALSLGARHFERVEV